MSFRKIALLCAVAALTLNGVVAVSDAADAPFVPQVGQAGKDVVWVPTPQALVDRMLDMAQISKTDYLIDLGSGDGRTVITAAKRGTRAHGIEYNPDMVALAEAAAKTEGVAGQATFAKADIFQSDFSKASVISLFLLTDLNLKLRPILLNMKPGTRIVSNTFNMGDWTPDDTINAGGDCVSWCTAYKWIIPAKVGGDWKMGDGQLRLNQTYQLLSGTMVAGGQQIAVTNTKLNGADIAFTAGGKNYTGKVDGNAIKGTIEGGGAWSASRS